MKWDYVDHEWDYSALAVGDSPMASATRYFTMEVPLEYLNHFLSPWPMRHLVKLQQRGTAIASKVMYDMMYPDS